MTIERAKSHVVCKPWGSTDPHPWHAASSDNRRVGEIWFDRPRLDGSESPMLLKLLFTTAPLSIQVHPTDAFAHSIGLTHGKTEAWYILSALPGAEVALGLKREITAAHLRDSIEDGSIADLMHWFPANAGDTILVPAGTIHAIGAGFVIAEIQQRSDATFRLFDYGRNRQLHVDNAVAVAHAAPADQQIPPHWLTNIRNLLVADPAFNMERVELPARSGWNLSIGDEAWLLVQHGRGRIGSFDVCPGSVMFVQDEIADIDPGTDGMTFLMAYGGSSQMPDLASSQNRPITTSPLSAMEKLS